MKMQLITLIKPVKAERFQKAVEKAKSYSKLLDADHSSNILFYNITNTILFVSTIVFVTDNNSIVYVPNFGKPTNTT